MSRAANLKPLKTEPQPKKQPAKRLAKAKRSIKTSSSFRLRRHHNRPTLPRLVTVRQLLRESFQLLGREWKIFGGLAIIYAVCYRVFVEGLSKLDFSSLQQQAEESSNANRVFEAISTTGSAFGTTADHVSADAFYASLLTIIFTLAVVWALRQVLAGQRIRIRDALYNCMAPFVSVVTVLVIIFLQTIPLTIGIFIYAAATASGVAQGGVQNMAVFILSSLLALLSCYWLSTSIIGLMAATLPGMYPLSALRAAKELVATRRWVIFLRIVVFALLVGVVWLVVIVAVAATPLTNLFMGEVLGILRAATLVLSTVLLYKLYRSLVDESATA